MSFPRIPHNGSSSLRSKSLQGSSVHDVLMKYWLKTDRRQRPGKQKYRIDRGENTRPKILIGWFTLELRGTGAEMFTDSIDNKSKHKR